MRHRVGDQVTVVPAPGDPYILQFQRYGFVSRQDVRGRFYVRLGSVMPADEDFGPLPAERLLCGWQDERGRWR